MKYLLQGATALAALAATTPAFATEGWYGRFDLGYSFDANGDLSSVDLFDGDPLIVVDPIFPQDRFFPGNNGDIDEDWVESIGVGYAFLNSGFRVEGEIAHRYNDGGGDSCEFIGLTEFCPNIFDVDLFPLAFVGETKVHAWSYMLNGYYDFNKGGSWEPYLGAGIGVSQLLVKNSGQVANFIDFDTGDVVSASEYNIDDDDWVFTWQLMAGVAFRATDQLMIDVGYRYMQADSGSVDGVAFEHPLFDIPQEFFSSDFDYDQSAILVGLRWQFQAPEPPPAPYTPPPPPTCPAEQYTAERGKDLAAAMDAAAAQSRTCNYSAVTVTGPDSQMPTVRDGLVQRGVPSNMITTQPSGAATGPVTITLN